MSQSLSPPTGLIYGRARVLAIWGLAPLDLLCPPEQGVPAPQTPAARPQDRTHRRRPARSHPRHHCGFPISWRRASQDLGAARIQGVRTSKPRVLRLMPENQLLAPQRQLTPPPEVAYAGSILTEQPNQMWGTDATTAVIVADGQVTVFAAVDHCTAECVGIHVAKRATRFEALEPLRQGVREQFGGFDRNISAGFRIRHDHGSQYMSDHFQQELRFLGVESSSALVGQPEGNGCIERFFRTLKEQLLWVRYFENLDQLQTALRDFLDQYNRTWLIERLLAAISGQWCA